MRYRDSLGPNFSFHCGKKRVRQIRYLAPPAQNARVANPANLHPGNELTQTAADGIITSFPTFPGMSCLANLAVGFVSWLGQGSS
ncbi:hypothetical protein D9C73_027206 [Collichthys lucidus]|uniref:Uncharacterized protein n=1 Tax=Collichthys lucidus TaxID=240159 RepID=A0A4U5VVJ4_COLLU|nr:hypothetical protein D9C73_027206 [Collichthys lucidus]